LKTTLLLPNESGYGPYHLQNGDLVNLLSIQAILVLFSVLPDGFCHRRVEHDDLVFRLRQISDGQPGMIRVPEQGLGHLGLSFGQVLAATVGTGDPGHGNILLHWLPLSMARVSRILWDMATLATIPATITVTGLRSEAVLVAGIRVPKAGDGTLVVPFTGRADGNKSNVWDAFFTAQEEGHLTSNPVLTALTDGVASGHTLSGGQDAMGAVTPE